MNINFINYNGIKGYARVMYNDVKDADKYKIEVAYNGKDVKDLLEYLFKLESKIDKAIEYYETHQQECVIGRNKDEKLIKDYYLPAQCSKKLYEFLKEDKQCI